MNYLVALEKELVYFPGLGWKFHVNNVAIEIAGIKLYWYGILIAAAVALCLYLGMKQCRKHGLTPDLLTDFCLLAIPLAFVGARIYYVACEWSSYYVKGNIKETLSQIANVRSGGLAIYGGILGAGLAIILMGKLRKVPISTVMDFAIVYIPLGQAIGRWGNFFNQEAFGTTTDLPWGMKSTTIARYLSIHCPHLDSSKAVHPTFFYESVCTFIIFFALLVIRGKSKRPWTTVSCYCIFYGIVRFFIEGLRTDSLYIGSTGLRISQVLSLILVVLGLLMISLGRVFDWQKQPIPERFIKADEAMQRQAQRKKEQNLRRFEEDEDEEDRVERLAKSSFKADPDDEEDADGESGSEEEAGSKEENDSDPSENEEAEEESDDASDEEDSEAEEDK